MARPTPLPGYSLRVWSRWKILKTRSLCSPAMPMPLSKTENSHSRPFCSAEMVIHGFRLPRNFYGIANQILEQLHYLEMVSENRRQRIAGNSYAVLFEGER